MKDRKAYIMGRRKHFTFHLSNLLEKARGGDKGTG
jgi:hypothetical protein